MYGCLDYVAIGHYEVSVYLRWSHVSQTIVTTSCNHYDTSASPTWRTVSILLHKHWASPHYAQETLLCHEIHFNYYKTVTKTWLHLGLICRKVSLMPWCPQHWGRKAGTLQQAHPVYFIRTVEKPQGSLLASVTSLPSLWWREDKLHEYYQEK